MSSAPEKNRLQREIWSVVICLLALLITLSLISYDPSDRSLNTPSGAVNTHNWGGFIGAFLADLLLQSLGMTAYLIPVLLCLAAIRMFRANYTGVQLTKALAYAVLLLSLGVILSVAIDTESARDAGGIIGGFLNERVLVPLFGRLSAVLIACFTMLLSVMVLTQNSLLDLLGHTRKSLVEFRKSFVPAVNNRLKEFKEKTDKRKGENTKKERKDYVPPPIVLKEEIKDEWSAKKSPDRKSVV